MRFKSLVSPCLRGPYPIYGTHRLWKKGAKLLVCFIPLLLLNRAPIYMDLRKSLSLWGGLNPQQAWHCAERTGCFHKDTLQTCLGLQQRQLEFRS